MKTIINALAVSLLAIASADAGTISRIVTQETNALIEAKLDAGEELRVFVGEEGNGWSGGVGVPSIVQAKVELSGQVPHDDGSKGKGLIVQVGQSSILQIPLVANGPIPVGELVFRQKDRIGQQNGVWTFADIHQKGGKTIPVSVKVRGGGNW